VRNDSIPRGTLTVILLCFFASGAAGLVYQVAWSKALGLVFGHTVHALAVVLAVFMAGLALGSAVIGRWSERRTRPVALYGWLELLIAALGAASLAGLAGVRWLYFTAYPSVEDSPALQVGLRAAGSALVLFLPTFLMGGTLPVLVRGLVRTSGELGARLGRLYWVNTAGAVAGTLAAGFLLLPAMGLRRTVAVAVALNVLAGLLALLLDRRMPPVPVTPPEAASLAARRYSWLLLGAFAAVGATAMVYEIAWTRMLATMVGSSTYAFTLMLATFLAGIVIGSWLFERWLARGGVVRPGSFATTQLATALAALAFLVYYDRLPELLPPILRWSESGFGGLVLAQFISAALAMLPAAVAFGFNFPVATVLVADQRELGGRLPSGHAAAVGRAYAANTFGAIAGATATGFWLLPLVGSFRAVALAAAVNLVLAIVLELRAPGRRPLLIATSAATLVLVAVVGSSPAFYNRTMASFATVLYWDVYQAPLTLREVAETTDILFAEDGLNASITVVATEDYLALRSNGKVDASNRDAVTQLMAGHIGALYHPAPRRVLVIGFGSGMTVSAVALHPGVERIDCVEIEPAVIRAARHLEPLHRGVLDDPRLRLVADDARNFLLTTRQTYDLIISEPSNPWIAGVSMLFTDEFYREARARLAPGGVFMQWVQSYALEPADVRMILATFLPHFPRTTLWRGEPADFLLVAETAPGADPLARLRELWDDPALARDFHSLGMRRPEGLLAFHLLEDAGLRRIAGDAPRNTDDHTRLEYRAPRSMVTRGLEARNFAMVVAARDAPLPASIPVENPGRALAAVAETLFHLEEFPAAESALSLIPLEARDARVELLHGRLLLARNAFAEARKAFGLALAQDPTLLDAAWGLGEIARKQFDHATAAVMLLQVLNRDPLHLAALESLALNERQRERWREAAVWQQRLAEARPAPSAHDWARLGEYRLRGGDDEAAEPALRRALEIDPYNYTAHRFLAELHRARRNPAAARPHFEAVLRFHPDVDARAYAAFAELLLELGDTRAANAVLRKGRRIFPGHPDIPASL
jgi:spermidine synthase